MKRAVIYARYSSERQTEQSIEGQLTVCTKYAKDNDFFVIEHYIDRATTGTNDNRPAFRAMIKDSAKKEFQYIIVYKGDRFSRNRFESAMHKKTLRDNGVKLISATENIPDTPEGIILESLLEGMAEYYSAELSQKVKRGMNESRKKHQWLGGRIIYGYDIVDKKPVINEKEADVVNSVHKNYIEGKTARQIVNRLLSDGVRSKSGKPFTMSSIYNMLQQQRYIGDDTYPAIVPRETKEKVNKMLEENKRAPGKKKSYGDFVLSGKLYCGECGGLMTGDSGTSRNGDIYYYYKCFEKKKHTEPCTFPAIKKDVIEKAVFDICCEVLNSGFIPHIVNKAYKMHEEDLGTNISIINLKALISEKEKAVNNIMTAIEKGIITETTKERLVTLESELEQLKSQLSKELSKADSIPTKEEYSLFLSRFIGEQADNDKFKNDLINLLVSRIVIFDDKLCITFNFFPDNDKGRKRDYKLKKRELTELQCEFQNSSECSNLFAIGRPKGKLYACLFH